MNPTKKHPNATVSLVSGSGIGTLLAWLLGRAGVHLQPEEATAIAGAVSAAALFVGRNGIRGLAHIIWKGSSS